MKQSDPQTLFNIFAWNVKLRLDFNRLIDSDKTTSNERNFEGACTESERELTV